jgi:uncharacterized protein
LARSRIFFVTDVHGSDRCFRKFINAGKFYSVGVLVLGGDITGKMIIPLIKQPDGVYECEFGGTQYSLRSQDQINETLKAIKDSGFYPYMTDQKEFEELSASPELINGLFKKLMRESIEGWMKLAEERLKDTGISCYVSPGNDDFFEIDSVLNSAAYVINPEEKVIQIDGEHEMITLGYANHTPWNSPREVDEDVLQRKIDDMASQVRDMKKALFNLHVPPINTVIDQAPKLDANLKPVVSGGGIVMISAGSTAVRNSIERYQPLAGMHGHIHESRGIAKIGRTTCFNPGSEYNSGVLKGLILDIEKDQIKSYMLTSG